jgi:23S rRNA (uracil1939-C5)-methyltransferase
MRVHFHAIAAGGDAVGRDENNRTVFAPYAAPGDVADVVIEAEHRSYARGRLVHLETASPQRVAPPCPYYLPSQPGDEATACGGCQLQHLSYAAQLEAKREIVRDALRRLGKLSNPQVRPCIPAPLPFGYRNKADFVIGVQDGQPRIGFFARNSHHLIDIEHCPLQQEPNNELLQAVRQCLAEGLAPPFDAASGQGVLRRLVARTASNGESLLIAATTGARWPQELEFARRMHELVLSLVGVLRREPRRDACLISGRDWIEESVTLPSSSPRAALQLRATGEAFFQVNTPLVPQLVATALSMAAIEPGQRALDLFCGVGLFGLAMAAHGARVTGIEASRGAVRDAQANTRRNGLEASFVEGASGATLKPLGREEWDVALLDPPRAGAAAYLAGLLELRPRRIVYVSCDPATLARDIASLSLGGYNLVEAAPLDIFPQTAHVETVARLERE